MKGAKTFLILVFLYFAKADDIDEYCNVYGQCFDAQISHLITTSTPLECLESCVSFDDCEWYSFRSDVEERNCELYKTCPHIRNTNECCISGQNTCPVDRCETPGFCLGTVIASHNHTPTRFYCDLKCQKEPACKYYSHSTENNTCYLFGDCHIIDETVIEFESSQVGCPLTFW